MVPEKGLEPPHACAYMDLNHLTGTHTATARRQNTKKIGLSAPCATRTLNFFARLRAQFGHTQKIGYP